MDQRQQDGEHLIGLGGGHDQRWHQADHAVGGYADQEPGVCGALVTTTLGLLVAIPATFGYNYLLTQVKIMTTELENFASSLADRVELELEGEARRNFEAAQERERLQRAAQAAQAAAAVAPAAAAAPAPEAPPAALPGWEDAQ